MSRLSTGDYPRNQELMVCSGQPSLLTVAFYGFDSLAFDIGVRGV